MQKRLSLGNLNIVWGKKAEEPLLTYWDEIVWPSLKEASNKKTRYKSSDISPKYFVSELTISKYDGVFYLQGVIIKDTMIEIGSQLDDKDELVPKDIKEKSAPYSLFFLNLANHRIGLVANQKGSPTLANVKIVFELILKEKVRSINKEILHQNEINDDKKKRVLMPIVNLTSLPISSSVISDAIMDSYRVSKIVLDFFPLNGDIPEDDLFDNIQKTRQNAESDSAEFTLKSPANKKGVASLVRELEADGTAGLSVDIIPEKGGETQKFTNRKNNKNSTSVNAPIELDIDDVSENKIPYLLKVIKSFVIAKDSFFKTSAQNQKVYDGAKKSISNSAKE